MCSPTSRAPAVLLRHAAWPGDVVQVTRLLQEYFATLRSDPDIPRTIRDKDRGPELMALPRPYDSVASALWLAESTEGLLGCAAVHLWTNSADTAELKRLYVRPAAQRRGVGKSLLQAVADWSRQQGARKLLLDTLPRAMPAAVRLYESVGFVPTERYNENDASDFAFFCLHLQ